MSIAGSKIANPSSHRRRAARSVALAGFGLAVSIGGAIALSNCGTGRITVHGRVVLVPVPYASIRIASDEGSATYLVLGEPDLGFAYSRRHERLGWTFVDRIIDGYRASSTSTPDLLLVAHEERAPFITGLKITVVMTGEPPRCDPTRRLCQPKF